MQLPERRKVEDLAKLEALRSAAANGIDDIEAGRFQVFETAEDLREHLNALVRRSLRG